MSGPITHGWTGLSGSNNQAYWSNSYLEMKLCEYDHIFTTFHFLTNGPNMLELLSTWLQRLVIQYNSYSTMVLWKCALRSTSTLNITKINTTTLSIKGLFAVFSLTALCIVWHYSESLVFIYCHTECHYAECLYVECPNADCHYSEFGGNPQGSGKDLKRVE
jgi:hypothetical protein